MYTKNAEVKAGLVILAALAAMLYFLFRAGGSELPWDARREVWLRFEQGFAAPKTDDPVFMNGFKVGRVSRVWLAEETRSGARLTASDRARLKLKPGEDATAREIYVLAAVEMRPDQRIPKGTRGEISVDLVGGRTVALLPGLSPEDLLDEDTRQTPIPSAASGNFADIQRSVQDVLDRVAGVADGASLSLEDVRALIQDVRGKIAPIDLTGIQGNVLEASASLKATLESVRARVDEIAVRLLESADNVRALTADGSAVVKAAGEDVKEVLGNLKELSATLRDLAVRLGPKVDGILDDVAAAVRSARGTLEEFQGLGAQVKTVVSEAGVDFDRVLARLAETGLNLVDASEDLRAHPWKLLNKPDDKGIAFENLRSAASNYVRASQAIQEALADFKTIEARPGLAEDERKALLDRAARRMEADLQRYEDAARRFSELLRSPQAEAPR